MKHSLHGVHVTVLNLAWGITLILVARAKDTYDSLHEYIYRNMFCGCGFRITGLKCQNI